MKNGSIALNREVSNLTALKFQIAIIWLRISICNMNRQIDYEQDKFQNMTLLLIVKVLHYRVSKI